MTSLMIVALISWDLTIHHSGTVFWWVICARLKPSHKHQKYIYCRKLQVSTSICHFNLASWCISRGRFFFVQRIHIHNAIGTTWLSSTAAIIHASISILSNVLSTYYSFLTMVLALIISILCLYLILFMPRFSISEYVEN